MTLTCPFCDTARETAKVIAPGARVRCPGCKKTFVPVPLAPSEDGLLMRPDSELPPPSRLGTLPQVEPARRLHGKTFNPMDASRRTMAIALGVVLMGLVGLFFNWYAHTIHNLEKMSAKAGQKRVSKINTLASSKSINKVISIQPTQAKQPDPHRAATPAAPPTTQSYPGDIPRVNQPYAAMTPPANSINMGGPTNRIPSVGGMTEPVPPAPTPYVAPPEPKQVKMPDAVAEKKANGKLYLARKHERDGKPRLAAKVYQEILDKFPDTEAALTAQGKGNQVVDKRVDKAQEEFAHAQQFEKTNSLAEAKAEYEGVISRYPETDAAKRAKERLAALNKN